MAWRGQGKAVSVECQCHSDFTCGYCLRNAPVYFGYNPDGPWQGVKING